MPDCFLSYSSDDERLALLVEEQLRFQHLDPYMASVSLRAGQNWTQEVWANLKASPWVIFLASRAACSSPYVQQELGGALATEKRIVPIVWDLDPKELPGWISQTHALDLRQRSVVDLQTEIVRIADEIKADKVKGLFVFGAVVGALWAVFGEKK